MNQENLADETLEARTNVAFPRVIGMSEFEKLFEYVTEQIQGELRYSFESNGHIGNMFPAEKEHPRRREKYMDKLTGTLTARLNFPRSLYFSTNHDNNYLDFARISGLKFEFIGFDDHEVQIEEIDFMETVKGCIRKYFEYTSE